jgi:hypothetical protein
MKLIDDRRHLRRVMGTFMPPSLNRAVADPASSDPDLAAYDKEHVVTTYVRMLDANAEGADWREVSLIVLHIDPERDPGRARRGIRQSSRAGQMGVVDWIPANYFGGG